MNPRLLAFFDELVSLGYDVIRSTTPEDRRRRLVAVTCYQHEWRALTAAISDRQAVREAEQFLMDLGVIASEALMPPKQGPSSPRELIPALMLTGPAHGLTDVQAAIRAAAVREGLVKAAFRGTTDPVGELLELARQFDAWSEEYVAFGRVDGPTCGWVDELNRLMPAAKIVNVHGRLPLADLESRVDGLGEAFIGLANYMNDWRGTVKADMENAGTVTAAMEEKHVSALSDKYRELANAIDSLRTLWLQMRGTTTAPPAGGAAKGDDPTAYRPAKEFLKEPFGTYKGIRKALEANGWIRRRSPRKNRLEIHAGDWSKFLGQQPPDPLDVPNEIVDAALAAQARQAQEREKKIREEGRGR